jgi:hypothetical protein
MLLLLDALPCERCQVYDCAVHMKVACRKVPKSGCSGRSVLDVMMLRLCGHKHSAVGQQLVGVVNIDSGFKVLRLQAALGCGAVCGDVARCSPGTRVGAERHCCCCFGCDWSGRRPALLRGCMFKACPKFQDKLVVGVEASAYCFVGMSLVANCDVRDGSVGVLSRL